MRLQPVVRDVLHTELAAAVLRDQAWPALAVALEQAHQAGAEPAQLLREVAEQRELRTAKHPAQVLTHRLVHRSPTTADLVASNYPTALTGAPLRQPSKHSGTDLAVLEAALELSHQADAEHSTAGAAASTPQDLATPHAGAHTDGTAQGQTQHKPADATSSRAAELPAPAGRLVNEPPPLATAGHAAGTAARSYPTGLNLDPPSKVVILSRWRF